MLWALKDNQRLKAMPGKVAICPCCNNPLIAKCGSIKSWHWCHRKNDCDDWHEPESDWHIGWKNRFPADWQEIVMGCHRADVRTPKLIVELQASSISDIDIMAREQHYMNMVWLVKGENFKKNLSTYNSKGTVSFRWRWPRKSWWAAKMPIVFDLSSETDMHGEDPKAGLLLVHDMDREALCCGSGEWITEEKFLDRCGINGNFEPGSTF